MAPSGRRGALRRAMTALRESMEPAQPAAERWEAGLVPDSVLPSQLGEGPLAAARLQPEKRLQLAVLEDAIVTLQRSAGDDRPRALRLREEVDVWLASDATDSPFAFVTICDTLNLDPAYIRAGLRRWRTPRGADVGRWFRFRRDAKGTRHQVLLYPAPLERSA